MSTSLRLQKLARCEVIQRLVRALIVVEAVAAMPLPLPPLAKQHRIVAKVDALMALCDRWRPVSPPVTTPAAACSTRSSPRRCR
jgi:hypothetical protein